MEFSQFDAFHLEEDLFMVIFVMRMIEEVIYIVLALIEIKTASER